MKIGKKTAATLLSMVGVALLVTVHLFLNGFETETDPHPTVDAIVVLTGGIGRTEEGLRLYREGMGKYLIISGVKETIPLEAIFPKTDLATLDRSRIIMDAESQRTVHNASTIRDIATTRGFRSLLLVTSNYHMRRSYEIFRVAMGGDIPIYRHPVSGPNFSNSIWWTDAGSVRIFAVEYVKFWWFQIWQRWVEL